MQWESLSTFKKQIFYVGTIFRCRNASKPYEGTVDFLLINYPHSDSGFALIVASGFHTGELVICLPTDAKTPLEGYSAVSVEWVKLNWAKWVSETININSVYVSHNYPVPQE